MSSSEAVAFDSITVRTQEIGNTSEGKSILGDVPVMTYFDFQSRGRGEVVRLFFVDAGIPFKDVRWSFDGYNSLTEEQKDRFNPTGHLPFVLVNGTRYTQTYSMLRKFARDLGAYDGETTEEKYFVDKLCDLGGDWRSTFVSSVFTASPKGFVAVEDETPFKIHKNFHGPRYIRAFEKLLEASAYNSKGPFVLGDRVTYADFVLWQILHDETFIGGIDLEGKPRIRAFYKAIEERPNIKAYQQSAQYFN